VNEKRKKIRLSLRKNRGKDAGDADFRRKLREQDLDEIDAPRDARVSGKGELTRQRTVVVEGDVRAVDKEACRPGRVLWTHGQTCEVQLDDGRRVECVVRRLLRTLATDERGAVVAGDRVLIDASHAGTPTVERVEPRHGTLVRQIQGRKQVLAANVDQAVIVASCADPPLKPGLIDRFLITAESSRITPIICLNKSDLADPAERENVRSVYAGLGYTVLVTNAVTGEGCADLAARLAGRASVVAGQSGVGKSSLLNAVQPGLGLKTGQVSDVHRKGKHTTTRATLIPLACGGWVVDTPGIRQFELCAVPPQESGRWFVEFQNLSAQCRFADCTHVHETDCAVKAAVERGEISRMRYDSYRRILLGEPL